MPALLTIGLTAIRDSLKTLVSHVGISTANDAFNIAQTAIDPTPGTNIIKAATDADVDAVTFDSTITVTGAGDGTGSFFTVSILDGATRTDPLSRHVRTNAIGIDADDTYTVAVRVAAQDNTP